MTRLSIFPKFCASMSADELAATMSDVGLDGCNLVVRDGYWCGTDDLKKTVAPFVAALRHQGLDCPVATWADPPEMFLQRRDQLQLLRDQGIAAVRVGYFNQQDDETYAQALRQAVGYYRAGRDL